MSFNGNLQPSSDAGEDLTTKGDLHGYSTENTRFPVGSDTNILQANSATSTGLEWIASGGGTSFEEIVRKTSDQSVSGTTPVDDSELTLAIGASKTFLFQFNVLLHETSTGDIKLSVTAPSGASGGYGNTNGNTATGSSATNFGSVQVTSNTTNTALNYVVAGWCTTGVTSGSITFQFSKNSGAGATVSLIGGYGWSADVT